MAANINLVEYQTDEYGRLYETKVELIESFYITESLLNKLQQSFPLVERDIYEEISSEEHYSIVCFKDTDVEAIIKLLEDVFLAVLKDDSKKLFNETSSNNIETMPIIPSQHIKSNDLSESIGRFRALTNAIYLFTLKQTQYSKNVSVVVKIG